MERMHHTVCERVLNMKEQRRVNRMNKAFELILDRLEDFKHWENDNGYPIHTMSETQRISKCKEIVHQVEKEYNNGWIPCSERLPEEHETMFVKLKGTDKWDSAMPEKISDDVNVTVEFDDGTRKTKTMHTIDGKWKTDINIVKFKVIAWQPLPETYQQK